MKAKTNLRRFDVLDVTKFICAWLVVVIHTSPLKPYSRIADVLTAQGVCRIAVPLFFSISSFLLFRNMSENREENMRRINRYCVRILFLYTFWSSVYTLGYIFLHYDSIAWGEPFVLDRIRLWILEASHYHLWYLLATIYAVPLIYAVYSKCGVDILHWVVPPLWILRCLQFTYNWLDLLRPMFEWLQQYCDVVTNVFFCAVPLMSVGIVAIHRSETKSNQYWGKHTALWAGIYLMELMITYVLSPQKIHFEYLFSTPVLAYYLLCWLVTLDFSAKNVRLPRFLRECSIWIYCIHPLFILVWDMFVGVMGIRRFLTVALCSAVSGLGYVAVKSRKDC